MIKNCQSKIENDLEKIKPYLGNMIAHENRKTLYKNR